MRGVVPASLLPCNIEDWLSKTKIKLGIIVESRLTLRASPERRSPGNVHAGASSGRKSQKHIVNVADRSRSATLPITLLAQVDQFAFLGDAQDASDARSNRARNAFHPVKRGTSPLLTRRRSVGPTRSALPTDLGHANYESHPSMHLQWNKKPSVNHASPSEGDRADDADAMTR